MNSFREKVQNKLNAHGGFFKAVSVLAGGAAFAQLLSVATLPILTRLYTPEDFSIFAEYTSIITILAVVSCLRFEIAIPLPEEDDDAICLMILACISNILIFILTLLLIFLNYDSLLKLLKNPFWEIIIWLVPLSVFFSGVYNILQYWFTREKKFPIIAKTRINQSIGGAFSQVVFGVLKKGSVGLIVGQIINIIGGIGTLFLPFWKENKNIIKYIKVRQLMSVCKKYEKFPKYSTWEALANTAAVQLPIVIIAFFSVSAEGGFLMLAMKIMGIPIALIGGAISQVYLSHASEQYNIGNLKKYTIQIIKTVFKSIIIPFVIIGALAPLLFPLFFGKQWSPTGKMIIWMLPWFFMQILSSPISMSLYIVHRQKIALILQVLGLIMRVGGTILCVLFFKNYYFEYYALSGFIFYTLYLGVIMFTIDRAEKVEDL